MTTPLAQSLSAPDLGLPIGGFITLALLGFTFLFIKNMAGRLNRLPRSFTPAGRPVEQEAVVAAPPERPCGS